MEEEDGMAQLHVWIDNLENFAMKVREGSFKKKHPYLALRAK